jgi:hypothetical protein
MTAFGAPGWCNAVDRRCRPISEERVVSEEQPGLGESIDLIARLRAYRSVRSVLANDHDLERGVAAARSVVTTVLAESGVDGLAEVAVELSLKLASALERRAGDQGVAAVDLAEVWFAD